MSVPKMLVLKEGAPVILTRNLANGLYNGTRGRVNSLTTDGPPIIDFSGKLIPLSRYLLF